MVNRQTQHVLSGVPQGSVFGPLLFLVYINGVMDLPLSEVSQFVLYADDILLYKPIICQSDYSALQYEIKHHQLLGGGQPFTI